jgi:hypothetical protein
MSKFNVIFLLLPILLLSSCNAPQGMGAFVGHYEGFLFAKTQSEQGTEVSADVSLKSNSDLLIAIQQTQGKGKTEVTVHENGGGSVLVDTDSGIFQKQVLSPTPKSDCYKSSDSAAGPTRLQFCGDANQVSLTVSDQQGVALYNFQLSRLDAGQAPPMEVPADFTVSELVTRAKQRNFKTVVEFQKVLAARDNAINAHMNLLPHFTTGDAINVAGLTDLDYMKTLGDLTPFLLPSRWIRAHEASDQYQAEEDAWKVMDADGMNVAEGLAITVLGDGETISRLVDQENSIDAIRNVILQKEHVGAVQAGTSDTVTSIINQIDNEIVFLKGVQEQTLASLSQAVGFFNPRAIRSVTFGADQGREGFTIDEPVIADLPDWKNLAIARSPEYDQMKELLKSAQSQKRESYFDWLDPSASGTTGLGFGLPSSIAVGKDQIAEVQAQTDQVKVDLITSLSLAVSEITENVQSYGVAGEGQDIGDRRVDRLLRNFTLAIDVSMAELEDALKDQQTADTGVINAKYGYYLGLSKVHRILYDGIYSGIPFQK